MQSKNSKENSYPHFKYELEDSPPPKNRKFGAPLNQQITSKYSPLRSADLKDPKRNNLQKINEPKINRNKTPRRKQDDYRKFINEDQSMELSCVTHEGNFRRRDFDMRFNNIEAISQQISGLFDYVKRTEKKEELKEMKEERSSEFRFVNKDRKYSTDLNLVKQLPKELEPQSYYINTLEQEKIDKLFADKEQSMTQEHRKPYFKAVQQNTRKDLENKSQKMAKSPILRSSKENLYKYDLTIDLPQTKSSNLSKNLTPSHSRSPISQKISKYTPENRIQNRMYQYHIDIQDDSSSQLKYQESRKREDEFSRIEKDFRQKIKQHINNNDDSNKFTKKSNEIFFQIDNIRERIKSSEKRTHQMEKRYLQKKQYVYEMTSEVEQSAEKSKMIESKVVSTYSRPSRNIHQQNKPYNDRVSEFKINLSPVPTYEKSEKNIETTERNYQISATNRSAGDSLDCDKKQIVVKLIRVLSEQIDLDKRLRNARSSFSQMLDSSKWKKLKSYLDQRNYCYTEKQLQKQLEITPGEIDPFAEDYDRNANHIEKLGNCFIESEKFWEQKMTGVISKLESELSKFTIDQIDLSSKGYITIEDLVCFINLYGNTCFRNRDVLTLYRRFMALSVTREGIDMKGFMNKIVR